MKTKYKKLENELQEKRVNCSKAINNYQALEVEIHLLQKRLVTYFRNYFLTMFKLHKKNILNLNVCYYCV